MYLNIIQPLSHRVKIGCASNHGKFYGLKRATHQTTKQMPTEPRSTPAATTSVGISPTTERLIGELYATPRVVPMVLSTKESVVLSFDEVPGPRSLKYLASCRQYLTAIGTQITAGFLTAGLNLGAYLNTNKPIKNLSVLFDEYGPVVRFVSPIGADIVMINHPEFIEKVYSMEGDHPIRSCLDSLEKYRTEHRTNFYGGLYNVEGKSWSRQREIINGPLNESVCEHMHGINDICEAFAQKIYNIRSYQDETTKDLYKEIHKWAFDCMDESMYSEIARLFVANTKRVDGVSQFKTQDRVLNVEVPFVKDLNNGMITFSKKFTMLDTDVVYSQCDMSWLYHSLEKSTESLMKLESGLHLWKLIPTPAWRSFVKHCDCLDNLIGKQVLEVEEKLQYDSKNIDTARNRSLISSMLLGEDRMGAEDITTVLMDILLIGVNTITSSTSFLLYHLAKHQKAQRYLYQEINKFYSGLRVDDMNLTKIKEDTPYLQACLKETLRLAPPIPLLTRILPKNITLDKYNIPRGTLIIMSTQDASLKESNFDDATKFYPERWLKSDAKEYHSFASIPFGFGARKCLGQSVAESMITLLTIRLLQKYKLEYHYGDIKPTRSFIARPNRPLKIRFIDRI